MKAISTLSLFLIVCLVGTGCANSSLNQIGANALASTGYVDSQQAAGLLSSGQKIIASQEELTSEQEYYLGRAVSAKVLSTYPPKLDVAKTKYLNEIGMTLASVSDSPETFGGYHFAVIDTPTINALSAPGGFVFISSGFVNAVPDEDALAAVLAHEIAHVAHKDGANAVSNAALFSALSEASMQGASIAVSQTSGGPALGLLTNALSDSVEGVMEKLLTKGFDRSQEYSADLYAAELMQRAGYDPAALVRVLKVLEAQTGKDQTGWFATHPAPADRIEELQDEFSFTTAQNISAARDARFKRVMGRKG
jgi:predicted Zn-dependent protease